MFSVKGVGGTDVGRVRPANQDAFLVDEQRNFFIVADGMGGHAGGEIASQLCIERVSQFFDDLDNAKKDPLRSLDRAINGACMAIYVKALENPELKGMGTTATALLVDRNKAFYAHVGDSRIYLLRAGYIFQLSSDHSFVNEQLRAGLITKQEAAHHHLRNVITRSVGFLEDEDVDCAEIKLEKGDYFILCSDGLHGKVNETELAKIILEDYPSSVSKLIDLANERGGEDNITAVIIQIS